MENVGMSATMSLNDQFSPRMQRIEASARSARSEFEHLKKSSSGMVDSDGLNEANNQLQGITGKIKGATESFGSLNGSADLLPGKLGSVATKLGVIGIAIGTVLTAMKALVSAASELATLADQTSQTYARYDIMGSSDTDALDSKIQASAERSRANYLDTASAISKLSINAADAFSGGEDEVIAFSETVNKMFTLSGTTATEASAAMLQLTQAMGSGVLRGDELNSIFEQSPLIIQTIADSLGVSVGEIRNLASEGKITADVVKNAILGASDEINEQFESMPGTYGQIKTMFENIKIQALQPLLSMMTSISDYIMDHSGLIYEIGDKIGQIFGTLAGVWTQAGPALSAIGALLQTAILSGLNLIAAALDKISVLGTAVIAVFNTVTSVFMGVLNVGITVVQGIWSVVKTTGENIVILAENVKNKVLSMIYSAMSAFVDAKNTVAGFLGLEQSDNPYSAKASSYTQQDYKTITRTWLESGSLANAYKQGSDLSYWSSKSASKETTSSTIDASSYSNSSLSATGSDSSGSGSAAETTADNTTSIANNISEMKDVINEISEMMERQIINSFTSTQINIDMSNMVNNLASDMDLDAFQNGIIETIAVGTEGVHL